jgi:hypothetical protein
MFLKQNFKQGITFSCNISRNSTLIKKLKFSCVITQMGDEDSNRILKLLRHWYVPLTAAFITHPVQGTE